MRRNLTKSEERAYRLVHHEFKGLTVNEAARVMQVLPDRVRDFLQSAKKKAPQLFPILSPKQLYVLRAYENNIGAETIAIELRVSIDAVRRMVAFLRRRKFLVNKPKTVAYTPELDSRIIQRF